MKAKEETLLQVLLAIENESAHADSYYRAKARLIAGGFTPRRAAAALASAVKAGVAEWRQLPTYEEEIRLSPSGEVELRRLAAALPAPPQVPAAAIAAAYADIPGLPVLPATPPPTSPDQEGIETLTLADAGKEGPPPPSHPPRPR